MISIFKFVHKNKKGMSMKILKTAAVAMCIALPFQAFAESAKDDAVTETTVVATVNGKPIYYGDVVMLHDSHPQLSRLPLKDLFNPLLDNVIDTTLAYNAAVKEKLNADPKVEKRLELMKHQILAASYLEKTVNDNMTKEKLQKLYEQYVRDNPPQEGMTASHILVKTEAEAQEIIKKLNDGEDFGTLAGEYSIDKSAPDGSLGLFTRELMVPEFSDAAFAMKEGEISTKPVKTQYGYHIIKAGKRQMIEPPTYEEVESELIQSYRSSASADALKKLRADAKIKKNPLPDEK